MYFTVDTKKLDVPYGVPVRSGTESVGVVASIEAG
jgi:hypothetical protein